MKGLWQKLGLATALVTAGSFVRAEEPVPTSPAPAISPAPAPAASPEAATAAAPAATPAQPDASRQVQDSLLIVTSREGAGSGFVANVGGQPTLITNAHVIAGATRLEMRQLSGNAVIPGKGRLAVGADVAAFAAPAGVKPSEISQDVSKDVTIGDEVVICGNSLGQSVATEIRGKVVGIGPDVVEVDAPFVHGNSGSPILHLKSGKVIGIASYIVTRKHDESSKDSGVAEVRRFGYRLDTIKTWNDLNWPLFQAEAAQVQGIEDFTRSYFQFWHDLREHKGQVASLGSNSPRIQRHIRDLQRAAESSRGGRGNTADFEKAVTSFLWDLKSEAKQEFLPGRPVPRYWFTNHVWNEQKEIREEISKDLDSDITERTRL